MAQSVSVHLMSDLHVSSSTTSIPPPAADVTVLAGDIGHGLAGIRWAAANFSDRPVVYVPGNHEFYGQAAPAFIKKMVIEGARLGVTVLSDSEVTLKGVVFLGATLWTDFQLNGPSSAALATAKKGMTDYRRIRASPSYRRLAPADTVAWHVSTRSWLKSRLSLIKERAIPAVVVTHHAPSRVSLTYERLDVDLEPAYASNLDELVAESNALCWIHGHTHSCVDFMIGSTRVISNQRGYADEPVAEFDPSLVIDL